MPTPYSLDLRKRVVGFVEAGHSRHASAAHFGVSVSFVVKLMKNYQQTGSLAPKPSGGRRHSKLDPHRAFLLARLAEKEDLTMPELAAELAAASDLQVTPASISRWFIRNGYRFKKRCWPASKIAPTSARRDKNGRKSVSRGCGLSRIDWCSSTRPERPPRWRVCAAAV